MLIVGEPDCELGIKVLIDRPQDAGADRLVGVIAGYQKYGGPLITVDFGSATTFDMADKDGNFVGGVLAPGVELTHRIVLPDDRPPAAHPGREAGAR